MKPTLVIDYSPDSLLIHWLVLEKECPLEVQMQDMFSSEDVVKAPYYRDGDILIYDHATLVQFLQERYPGEQLLPPDPVSRAQIRQMCTLTSEPGLDLMPEIDAILGSGLKYLAGSGGFTLLDIYIGAWLSERVTEMPARVSDYWKRISSRPAYIEAAQ